MAPGETLSSLTVRATSTADTSRSGTAVVTVPRAQSQAATPSSQAGAPALPSVRTSSTGTLVVGLGEVDFRAVYFEPDTANLIEAYRPVIDAVGEELRGDSTLRVTLQAYTAPFGTAAGRDMVSASRVNFCRDYLIQEYGIAASRIIGESYASERAPEGASGTDWVSYRCVEFIVAR